MRDNDLTGAWRLTGEEPWEMGGRIGPLPCRVPGSVFSALQEAELAPIPSTPGEQAACEWVSRRTWTYACLYTPPQEPYEGRSEKHYLHLRVAGHGYVSIDGDKVGLLEGPWREGIFDVTKYMEREGSRVLSVTIERPMEDEGPVPRAGILDARVRSVAFCRIEQARAQGYPDRIEISARVMGFASGNVRCQYRVLLGDELVASHDEQERLIADSQEYTHTIPINGMKPWGLGGGAVYTVRLTIERGGTRCDQALLRAANRMAFFSSMPFMLSGLPYALHNGGARALIYGMNVLPPVSIAQIEAFARAGINLLRFHGPMPPDGAALDACDRLGIAVWQELPADPPAARDAARQLVQYPCVLAMSAGHALTGPDGSPAGLTHPDVAAVHTAARDVCPNAAFFPTSPAGPLAMLDGAYDGRMLSHDVHGPLDYGAQTRRRLDGTDALLLSKVGFQAPEALPQGGDFHRVYGSYALWLEELCGFLPDMDSMLRIGRFVQAEAVHYAVASVRRRDMERCAGLILWAGNSQGITGASYALLDTSGRERPALNALRRANRPLAVSAKMEKIAYLRGETLEAEIFLHAPRGESGMIAISAKLCDMRGVCRAEELWQVFAREENNLCGTLKAALPAETPEMLLLCLSAERAGETVFRDVCVLPVPFEGEPPFAPLVRLPKGAPVVALRDGKPGVVNDGPDALLGVAAYAGTEILFAGALMPWERAPIDLPEGFAPGDVRVEALNPRGMLER